MNDQEKQHESSSSLWLLPFKIIAWPFVALSKSLYRNWFSHLIGRVLRDDRRVYSIKFIWYGDSVYLHPMVWGSLALFFVTKSEVFDPGWPLFTWFILLAVCYLTVIYDFNIFRISVLIVCVVAVLSLAYVSRAEWDWNPLRAVADHIRWLKATVTPGFYIASSYVFTILIASEVVWAWFFHRVEIDESYVYERRFLQGATREPIFARSLKRDTTDLLELMLMGAADIKHQTRGGYKVFKNVPGASLGLGAALDSMLDHRRPGQIELEERKRRRSATAHMDDAIPDVIDEAAGEGE